MNKLLNKTLLLVILLFFMIVNISAHASDPVIINDSNNSYPLGLNFDYFEDKSTTLSFEDILSQEINKQFIGHEKKIVNFGKTKSAFWFRFNILNKMSSPQKLLLESSWPLYDKINLFIQTESGNFTEKKYGNLSLFNQMGIFAI